MRRFAASPVQSVSCPAIQTTAISSRSSKAPRQSRGGKCPSTARIWKTDRFSSFGAGSPTAPRGIDPQILSSIGAAVTRVFARWTAVLGLGFLVLAPSVARAQSDDPAALKLAEPDFTLIALPTSLRLPRFGSAFRVTHRFTRPLNDDFGDVAGDLFGIDAGAQIGLEYRFGIVRNGQVGIHRTSNKTIEFFGQYSAIRQSAGHPVDV